MSAQEEQAGEVDVAPLEVTKDGREPLEQTRGFDTTHGLALAHVKPTLAEVIERRARRLQVESPLLDFDEIEEQAAEEAARFRADGEKAREELFVGQVGERHATLLPPGFSSSAEPLRRAIRPAIGSRSLRSARRREEACRERGRAGSWPMRAHARDDTPKTVKRNRRQNLTFEEQRRLEQTGSRADRKFSLRRFSVRL